MHIFPGLFAYFASCLQNVSPLADTAHVTTWFVEKDDCKEKLNLQSMHNLVLHLVHTDGFAIQGIYTVSCGKFP